MLCFNKLVQFFHIKYFNVIAPGLLRSISLCFLLCLLFPCCQKIDFESLERDSRALADSTEYDTLDVTITPARWADPVINDSLIFTTDTPESGGGMSFDTTLLGTINIDL